MAELTFVDDDGERVELDPEDAASLLEITGALEAATVSACPDCRSRVLAVVALADVLDAAPPHRRANELLALADDAPTLHLYVIDGAARCDHRAWRDPGSRGVARRGVTGRPGARADRVAERGRVTRRAAPETRPAACQTPVASSASNDSCRHSTNASGIRERRRVGMDAEAQVAAVGERGDVDRAAAARPHREAALRCAAPPR